MSEGAVAGDLAELTLDELRLELAPEIADAAVFDGWGKVALDAAAEARGIDPAVAALAFPGGAIDMIEAWIARIDIDMARALPVNVLAKLPIRERIRRLVGFRLEAATPAKEALRRGLAIMAMPQNMRRTARLGWSSADKMWRLAGDTATDYNHYTKRTLLAAIYTATLAVFVDDTSEGHAETAAFLDRRIEGVMRFEKTKARLLGSGKGDEARFSLARLAGRLRYPAR
jgi:ubiquinone biosynthesis protein COQ9